MGVETHILPSLQRSSGRLAISFKKNNTQTTLDKLYQEGCLKARFPRSFHTDTKIGTLINTTGGLADGDMLDVELSVGVGTSVVITSQAAERVYKARTITSPAAVTTKMQVADQATLYWLPQETILFEGSALRRSFDVDVAASGRFLAAEMLVLGRTAMQEKVQHVSFFDQWRIRYGGRLVFADGYQLKGDITEHYNSKTLLSGAIAMATLLFVGTDAEIMKKTVRDNLQNIDCVAACSQRQNVLIVRMAGSNAAGVSEAMHRIIRLLDNEMNAGAGVTSPVLSRRIF